jgi:hypothetical protein
MKPVQTIISLLAVLLIVPVAAQAFWGDGDNRSGLNLETGYDVNTVATMTGRVVAMSAGDERHNAQCEVENSGVRTVVVLGPQRYWAEHGIAVKVGDDVTVRGSKAQGKDGVVYFLAQKITDTSQNSSVALRNESGRPAWAGKGMGNGGMTNRPGGRMHQQSHGRMGR